MRIAAMDLGTNTFRLLIGEFKNKKLQKIYKETNITRLGQGMHENNLICEDAIKRSASILKKYKMLTDKYNVNRIFAVGTSAFRNAINSETLINYLSSETGINIDIISGDKEAELTVNGVIKSMDHPINSFYHIDIGGGSTEVSFVMDGMIKFSKSMELGVVSLSENKQDISEMEENIKTVLFENINLDINSNQKLPLVATSGTPIVIACILSSLKEFNPAMVNEMKISIDEVNKIKEKLIKDCNSNKLEKYGTLLKGREDLIVPGSFILSETMNYLKNDCMIICEGGLLEGLSYQYN